MLFFVFSKIVMDDPEQIFISLWLSSVYFYLAETITQIEQPLREYQ